MGEYLFDVHLHYEWGLIPVFILAVLSMVGIGAGIGFWSPNHQTTSNLVQGLMMFIGFLSPVMMERDQLPLILQWIGYAFPTTYAASALREMLTVGWTNEVSVNALVLLLFVLASYWFIFKMIRWRAAE
ncbi:ABC-2 type transporter [compost metagenome]